MEPLRLSLKRSALDPKNRPLEITADAITFDGKSMRWSEVRDLRFGTVILQVQTLGTKSKDAGHIHEFAFRDAAGQTLRVTFQAGFTQKGRDGVDADADRIIEALDSVILRQQVARAREALAGGAAFGGGKLRIEGGAFHVQKGILFWKKTVSVPASEVRGRVSDGRLELSSTTTGKVFASLSLLQDWNAVVVQRALAASA